MSFAASRTFWPDLPMASESWSEPTVIRADLFSVSSSMLPTLAGESALRMNSRGLASHWMMSTRSRCSSPVTAWMRLPRWPMQAPMGSTLGLFELTATLERCPASRAMALSSTVPSATSGISWRMRYSRSSGAARETWMDGPRGLSSTFCTYTLIRMPTM